jgi:hypothetical protein
MLPLPARFPESRQILWLLCARIKADGSGAFLGEYLGRRGQGALGGGMYVGLGELEQVVHKIFESRLALAVALPMQTQCSDRRYSTDDRR